MGFKATAEEYRAVLYGSIDRADRDAVRASAIAYASLLRQMAERMAHGADRTFLLQEAQRHEYAAAVVTKWGMCEELYRALGRPTPQAEPAEPREAPSTPHAQEWIADAMERHLASVAVVETEGCMGTGFFVSDGLLLTNHHVVYDGDVAARRIRVTPGRSSDKLTARIVNASRTYDVALLQLEGEHPRMTALPLLRDYSAVRAGSDVMLIGNGLGFGLAPLSATVKYPKAQLDGHLMYTALTNPGDSGSPVLNRDGLVIGIHRSTTSAKVIGSKRVEAKGMSNATPVCDVLRLLSEWGVEV